jgi:gas vesicle protein
MTKQPQQSPHDSGSFLSGLGIGLIGGAVGYFLFATEKGEKLRKQLKVEWKDIQKIVQPETEKRVEESGSFKDLLSTFFTEMLEKAKEEQRLAEEEALKAKEKNKKGKKKLFKGVG